MSNVAKLVIIDDTGKCLLLYRNRHHAFGDDPDLPGGTMEQGELPLDTMIREVFEETKIRVLRENVENIYFGSDYSAGEKEYYLYIFKLSYRPSVILSSEHKSYSWVDKTELLRSAQNAKDKYMHMVYGEFV